MKTKVNFSRTLSLPPLYPPYLCRSVWWAGQECDRGIGSEVLNGRPVGCWRPSWRWWRAAVAVSVCLSLCWTAVWSRRRDRVRAGGWEGENRGCREIRERKRRRRRRRRRGSSDLAKYCCYQFEENKGKEDYPHNSSVYAWCLEGFFFIRLQETIKLIIGRHIRLCAATTFYMAAINFQVLICPGCVQLSIFPWIH